MKKNIYKYNYFLNHIRQRAHMCAQKLIERHTFWFVIFFVIFICKRNLSIALSKRGSNIFIYIYTLSERIREWKLEQRIEFQNSLFEIQSESLFC